MNQLKRFNEAKVVSIVYFSDVSHLIRCLIIFPRLPPPYKNHVGKFMRCALIQLNVRILKSLSGNNNNIMRNNKGIMYNGKDFKKPILSLNSTLRVLFYSYCFIVWNIHLIQFLSERGKSILQISIIHQNNNVRLRNNQMKILRK